MPVAVKGLIGNKEGVVLRKVSGRANDPGLWRILMKAPGNNDQYLQVNVTSREVYVCSPCRDSAVEVEYVSAV